MSVRISIAALVLTLAFHTSVASAQISDYSIHSGPNYSNRVVLSYDDCPLSLTRYINVINWAKQQKVGLVLAPLGDCRDRYKAAYGVNIANIARNHGQYVINHTYSHPDLTIKKNRRIRRQIENGVTSNYVRPPGGAYDDRVIRVAASMDPQRLLWTWNVDTRDWTGKTRWQVVRYVVNNTSAGDTVLMHMQWNAFGVRALDHIKARLAEKGLKLCRAWGVKVNKKVSRSPKWLPAKLPC